MADSTYFKVPAGGATQTARSAEVPNANWTGGMNVAASNAPGIGINAGGGSLVGSTQWSLLDQDGDARTPQVGQVLGGEGLTTPADWPASGGLPGKGTDPIVVATPSLSGDGTVTDEGEATLSTLAAGWTGA